MIVLHEQSLKDFSDYGIDIPVGRNRALDVMAALMEVPELSTVKDQWLSTQTMPEITKKDLLRVHDPGYVDLVLSDKPDRAVIKAYELENEAGEPNRYRPDQARKPLKELVNKTLANVAGTHQSSLLALKHGFSFFLSGGMHHAMPGEGRGFCLLNDVVITLTKLRREGLVSRVWVVDVDAHKGDGTAVCCMGDVLTQTMSVHMALGWPLDDPPVDEKGVLRRPFYPSTVDIPIYPGNERRYLQGVRNGLELMEVIGAGNLPDIVIVVAGSDPYELDGLEGTDGLRLSLEQLKERDMYIYEWFLQRGVPQSWLMAGGYGPHSWEVYAGFLQTVLTERLE